MLASLKIVLMYSDLILTFKCHFIDRLYELARVGLSLPKSSAVFAVVPPQWTDFATENSFRKFTRSIICSFHNFIVSFFSTSKSQICRGDGSCSQDICSETSSEVKKWQSS